MSAITEKTGVLLRNPTIRQTSASKQQTCLADRALPTVLILSMVFERHAAETTRSQNGFFLLGLKS